MQQNSTAAVTAKSDAIVDQVLARISALESTGGLRFPKEYSPENAIRAAWLILQDTVDLSKRPVLQSCTQPSIINALFKMSIQGLNPNKRQCSFIAYGDKLICQREYAGSIAIAKRHGMKSIAANVVYEGDVFSFSVDVETGLKKINEHSTTLDSIGGGKIKGAYAIITMEDGTKSAEVMTMSQIQAAWEQGPTKGLSPAHKKFPDQMSMKTVINRAVKLIINSSDDSDLFDDEENDTTIDVKHEIVKTEIKEQANKEEISMEAHAEVPINDAEREVEKNEPDPAMSGGQAEMFTKESSENQPNF